ncbi:hypothetical protein D0Z07_0098 [Hyphodiscus hymeniophilus]|uniref:Uncharacterized protein n=1 Tax=Hyphodiscus hymeniophilus TaxID=353542 RepID=A0A9P6VQU6_9HELO|nr:hypothetical protein D0Z07_0098 [Hyphodiscus hymeniophilus]
MPHTRQGNHRRIPSGQTSRRNQPSRLDGVRMGIHSLFSGRSTVGPRNPTPDSPKSPRFVLGLPNLSTTRLNVPYLTRSASNPSRSHSQRSQASQGTPSSLSAESPTTPISSRPITPNSLREELEEPTVSADQSHVRSGSARRFVGVDPAERHLAELAQAGRERQKHKRRHKERTCAPKIKNRKIRAKILICFISGMFLTLVLTIYLALALSNKNESEEFHVLLILIILVTTIFFCHALVRLCMMLIHPPNDGDLEQQLPSMIGPGGYANPAVPIQVALARDEEAAGIESEATKTPPPAYGLWRESVRVDPNRIFWQRNEAAAMERQETIARAEGHLPTVNRPPSYISEDGVDYVIEAAPRSIAPTTDGPLIPHPQERERGWPR